jgi:RNA polymerase sigma-70 factor (ECF subfamily)
MQRRGNSGVGASLVRWASSSLQTSYRLMGNRADAEDAVQDALLAACTHRDQFKRQSQMSSWVTAIGLNSARMKLRKCLRHVHVPLDEPIGEVQILSVSERLTVMGY